LGFEIDLVLANVEARLGHGVAQTETPSGGYGREGPVGTVYAAASVDTREAAEGCEKTPAKATSNAEWPSPTQYAK